MSKSLIYVIDDDPVFSKIMVGKLHSEGFLNIESFLSGEDALNIMAIKKPRYIFLDFSFNGLNGLDILSEIKKLSNKIKVFIITNLDDDLVAQKCINSGAELYLRKKELMKKGIPKRLKSHLETSWFRDLMFNWF